MRKISKGFQKQIDRYLLGKTKRTEEIELVKDAAIHFYNKGRDDEKSIHDKYFSRSEVFELMDIFSRDIGTLNPKYTSNIKDNSMDFDNVAWMKDHLWN